MKNVCPNCGAEWKKVVKICWECQTPLTDIDKPLEYKICSECGSKWKPQLNVCLNCLASLDDSDTPKDND